MFLTVDTNDKRPLYQQIVDGVKALIARGDLREGATLPSVRQVAGDLGVNLNTIAVAYRRLQEEGFLAIRHGTGTIVLSLGPVPWRKTASPTAAHRADSVDPGRAKRPGDHYCRPART